THPQTLVCKITDTLTETPPLLPRNPHEADLVIALTHIGYGLDLQLAGDNPDLDVIVGRDSHTYLPGMTLVQRPRDPFKPASAGSRRMPIPVVQDGEFGHDLGKLDLHFEQADSGTWDLRRREWQTTPITAS